MRSLVVLALLLTGCAADAPAPRASVQDNDGSVALTLGVRHDFRSQVYDEPRHINIYVPQSPDWADGLFETPPPVLYLMDGGTDQDFVHIAGLAQLPLVNAERTPPIVVGIPTPDRRAEISPRATDPRYVEAFTDWQVKDSDDFRRHIETDVMPIVAENHATGRRVLMGESLAGLFVVETLLERPGMFDDYVAVSPSLWWDDRALARTATDRLAAHGPNDRRLYITMADEGGTMQAGLDELLAALANAPHAPDVKYVDRRASDTHSSIYHGAARDALTWLHGIPAEPYGDTPWYLTPGGQPEMEGN